MEGDWIKVFESNESVEVSVAKAKLDEAGIEAVLLDKKDSAYIVIGRTEIYVPKDKAEQAKGLLVELIGQ